LKRARVLAFAVLAPWVFSAGAAAPGALPDIPTPYLPSTSVAVDEMLRLANVGPGDLVADLGSGDGRMVIAAARDYEFDIDQQYQDISGGMRVQGGYLPAFEARLDGDRISFVVVEDGASHRFEGRTLSGLEMEGEVRSGRGRDLAAGRWRATRIIRGAGENGQLASDEVTR